MVGLLVLLNQLICKFNVLMRDILEKVFPVIASRVFDVLFKHEIPSGPGNTEENREIQELQKSMYTFLHVITTHDLSSVFLTSEGKNYLTAILPMLLNNCCYHKDTTMRKDDPRKRAPDRNRHPEQREWKRRLQRSVDRLRDAFCQQHALELIFTEDGDTHLKAEMYLNMDGSLDEPEWFPSPIFQELFAKLNRMATLAAEMFVGRERFATILLMRLTETVILWLSNDQSFWDDIEEGPRPLGAFGLQQFYLDMKFVIHFSSQGRYLSRHLNQVINDIVSRVVAAFATTGKDPYRILPEDEWFMDLAQEAIERLTGKTRASNGDRDPNSPTASVSAQSVSSVRSHGSS